MRTANAHPCKLCVICNYMKGDKRQSTGFWVFEHSVTMFRWVKAAVNFVLKKGIKISSMLLTHLWRLWSSPYCWCLIFSLFGRHLLVPLRTFSSKMYLNDSPFIVKFADNSTTERLVPELLSRANKLQSFLQHSQVRRSHLSSMFRTKLIFWRNTRGEISL